MVNRELMLVKVKCLPSQRGELRDLADIFHGTVCDVSLTTMTVELTGKQDKMAAFQSLLEPYGACCGTCCSTPSSVHQVCSRWHARAAWRWRESRGWTRASSTR